MSVGEKFSSVFFIKFEIVFKDEVRQVGDWKTVGFEEDVLKLYSLEDVGFQV